MTLREIIKTTRRILTELGVETTLNTKTIFTHISNFCINGKTYYLVFQYVDQGCYDVYIRADVFTEKNIPKHCDYAYRCDLLNKAHCSTHKYSNDDELRKFVESLVHNIRTICAMPIDDFMDIYLAAYIEPIKDIIIPCEGSMIRNDPLSFYNAEIDVTDDKELFVAVHTFEQFSQISDLKRIINTYVSMLIN